MKLKRKNLAIALAGLAAAGVAYAATTLVLDTEITLSEGGNGHKPKLMRASDGTLVSVFGDSPAGAPTYYDTKADAEVQARDLFVKWCKPDADTAPEPRKTCNDPADWTPSTTYAVDEAGVATGAERTDGNVTFSTQLSSVNTAWKGGDPVADVLAFPGNNEKPNIKQTGAVMMLTWISQYCPDGDLRTAGVQAPAQRAIRYLERDNRVVPFACTWAAWSTDSGKNWSVPKQLSNGERDAKQDSSGGSFNTAGNSARIAISWQEDPEGLQLGEAEGPGDGASGANVTGGTDIWYTWANISVATGAATFAAPSTAVSGTADRRDGDGTERALGYRITDNWELEKKSGLPGSIINVLDGTGAPVNDALVEKGTAGASRANIAMVGTNTVLAWEETKGSGGLDTGKFVRYQTFPYNVPPVMSNPVTSVNATVPYANEKSGCVISRPDRSGKRVRFLTQSAFEATGVATTEPVAGRSGVNLAIFWREGAEDQGAPADIMLRRGMVDPTLASSVQSGLTPERMVPAVDAANCATSDYAATQALVNAAAQNISSRASVVNSSDTGLSDDSEVNSVENALAHRGVLRGDDLWVGYTYTPSLWLKQAKLENYNFWIRKFTFDGSASSTGGTWGLPRNVTNVSLKTINVREPRIFGTPASNAALCPTDATFCQNRDVIYLMWGTQTNVYPNETPEDLGVWGTVSLNAGASYATPVRISEEKGEYFDDDDSAYETQPQARPDGTKFYVVFNTTNATDGTSAARYLSGSTAQIADPVPPSSGGGGCTTANGRAPLDPTLPALAALGLIGLGLRRLRIARRD